MTVPAQNCDSYPFFAEWEELIVFEQDGVEVRGIATHSFREDQVRLIAPFEVQGSEYLTGFRPPLVALAAAMIARRKALKDRGLTVTDDCKRMCGNLFRLHSTKLRISKEIEQAKSAFLAVFQPEIDQLKGQFHADRHGYRAFLRKTSVNEEQSEKPDLREQLAKRFAQKNARISEAAYVKLKLDVEHELAMIQKRMIQAALIEPTTQPAPLKLELS